MHSDSNIQLLYKIIIAIDSDEIQELSLLLDVNLPKETILKLKKMLNYLLLKNSMSYQSSSIINFFLNFLD